jgi:serine/threonine protein kinase
MTASADGSVLAGRYRLIAPIGSGGAGTVYRALDTLLEREVAVKKVQLIFAANEAPYAEIFQRTFREARAAARINHPGVAAVYDVVTDADRPCIVMQLVEGRPLSELLAEHGPLPPYRVADIGRQVLAALTAGHAVGVLHRDLKPGNVLITPDWRAVLTDFGIASVAGDPSITRTGVVLGTPSYVAPERVKGEAATPAADLWSLGATLYAAIQGRGPYDDCDGPLATLYAIITRDPPELPGDEPLCQIITALLRRDPQRRPGPDEIAEVLDLAAADMPRPQRTRSARAADARRDALASAVPATDPLPDESAQATQASGVRREEIPTDPDAPVTSTSEPLVPGEAEDADSTRPAVLPQPPTPDRPRLPGRRRAAVLVGGVGTGLVAAVIALVLALAGTHNANTPPPKAKTPQTHLAAQSAPPPVTEDFRVAAAVNADGIPELFARAQDGSLMSARYEAGSWSRWTALPGGRVYTGVPAVARARDGRLVMFAREKNGKLAELLQMAPGSGSWDSPVELGSVIIRSSPAVVAWPDGHLEVFALLDHGHLGHIGQRGTTAGASWSGWASLGGSLAGPPAAALDSAGHPEVVAVATNLHLVHDYYANGSWAGWSPLPGGPLFAGVPAIGMNQDGRLEVLARSTDGDLLHVWQQSQDPTRWGGPLRIVENALTSDPAVYNANGHRLEAFAADHNEGVSHSFQTSPAAGTAWTGWEPLGGSAGSAPATLLTPSLAEIFVRARDGAIQYDRWTAAHGWSGWKSLGGSF